MTNVENERAQTYWTERAWLPSGWAEHVLLRVGADGHWAEVAANVRTPPVGTQRLAGVVLPGLVNAHSHAFQRAFAGMAESRSTTNPSSGDDFWSWRDRMYRVALRISPEQMRAVATQLYAELLAGGYTHVCEFHYLRRAIDGRPYDDPMAMAWALVQAANDTGMGLTLMPVLYERAGFAQSALRDDQRRFAANVDDVMRDASAIDALRKPLVRSGLAIHSLRAAAPSSIHALRDRAASMDGPVHIHVAEQTAEVDDCIKANGARPVAWLLQQHGLLDARWHLVHATHTVQQEIDGVAASGAGLVLCPTTEANLGDGLADVPAWLLSQTPISIGSDSHVGREWREELRWLEYGQRLSLRRRNVAAGASEASTAKRLWSRVQQGGALAAGLRPWGLCVDARADLLVANEHHAATQGVPTKALLDALVFSGPSQPWSRVMVAGRWVIDQGRHLNASRTAADFGNTMQALWGHGD